MLRAPPRAASRGSISSLACITSRGFEACGDLGDAGEFVTGARADEGALADMAPQLAMTFEHGEGLAQFAPRYAKDLAQLALGRQPRAGRQILLRQVGPELNERALRLVCPWSATFLTNLIHLPNQSQIG